jgi:Ca2+-binding EF-hand superfamily protein
VKNLKLAILAGALTSIAAVAVAQNNTAPAPQPNAPEANQASPEQPRRMGRLARLDANNDGAIDQQEFATVQSLKDADANGDGTLTTEELGAMILKRQAERRAERISRRLDIDGDGKVTLAEIEKNRAERFALMDRNDDGKLQGNELRRGGRHGGERWADRRGGDHHFERHGERDDWRHGKRWQRQSNEERGGSDGFPMDL